MRLPPPPLPSLFLSSLARLLHLPFPLPFSLPVAHAGTLAAAFGLFYPFSCLSLFLYLSRVLAFFIFLLRSATLAIFTELRQPSDSSTSPFRFFHILPTLSLSSSLFYILSGEFLIIESRRDRERLARTWKILTLFSPRSFRNCT